MVFLRVKIMDQRHQWIMMYRAKHLVLRHEPIRRFFLNFHMLFTYTYTCAHTYVDYTYNISMSNFENTLHAWRSRQHESATIGPAGLLILGKEWWKRMLDPALWERESLFSYYISCLDVLFTKPKTLPKCRREDPTCCPADGGVKHLSEYCLLLMRQKRGHLVIWSLA